MLPAGWPERLVLLDTEGTVPGRGLCLEPHDCVVSKLIARRAKDFDFAAALIGEHLIDPNILLARIDEVAELDVRHADRLRNWITAR